MKVFDYNHIENLYPFYYGQDRPVDFRESTELYEVEVNLVLDQEVHKDSV